MPYLLTLLTFMTIVMCSLLLIHFGSLYYKQYGRGSGFIVFAYMSKSSLKAEMDLNICSRNFIGMMKVLKSEN